MQAMIQTAPGNASTLQLGRIEMPTIGAGQLLIRSRAAGVNRADIVQREGRYPAPAGASPILGLETAGEVVAIGTEVTGFAPGDPVFGLVAGGAYAEYVLLDADLALRKPDALSWAEAASLPEAWMTAWFNLVEHGDLRAGQAVLIHAGASGVGSAAIQLARRLGATVFATAGSEAKCAHCRELGADLAIDYTRQDFAGAVKAAGGVDLILDCIGADYLDRNLAALRPDGRLINIGLMGGSSASLNLGLVLVKRLRLQGSTLRSQPLPVKTRLTAALREQILPGILSGELRLTLDRTFDWTAAAAAHTHLEANRNLGKVVLTFPPAVAQTEVQQNNPQE